jgi:hypothetical protein
MVTMINFLQQVKNTVVKSLEREVYVDPTYYNLVINDHISRTNKTMPFNSIKDAMNFVYERDLMNNPIVDVQIIQVNHDGKNHVLRVTTSKYVPEEA